ncbi:putative N-acetylated-alpha-linked acidic dipeptidase [Asterias amurensis]|uniref:putative N-acetylated-alpha-linked acidic dipeptidase n=1 Tax=Asterias amurensis TaxID=7602 RepID=UPI003AB87301
MGTDSNNRAGSGAAYTRFAEEMDIDAVDLNVKGAPSKVTGLKLFCLEHWKVLIVLVISFCCFGIGIILGHFFAASATVTSQNGYHNTTASTPTAKPTSTKSSGDSGITVGPPSAKPSTNYMALVHGHIQKSNFPTNLKNFTTLPHHAGSSENTRQVDRIYRDWRSYGFDVAKKSYLVSLSRPNPAKPNKITIFDSVTGADKDVFTPNDTTTSQMLQPFVVYGTNASITNKPLYVNYATRQDFKILRTLTPLDFRGSICIARLGRISLALMASNSKEQGGCIGLIAFPDPEQYNMPGVQYTPANTFPYTWWMPLHGVVRESARFGLGDPSSPFFPSHDWTPRQPISNQIEEFPVQTISYNDATAIIRAMANPPASNPDWIGKLQLEKYYMGPGFHDQNRKLTMEVNNEIKLVNITNVIATIKGTVEPDRYVIIGNHRDSLAHGVVDPGSGTVCLLEVARVLSELMGEGWKPRRSIILASWDAGEDGSIGSTEWIEENMERLHSRAVAYINLDEAVSGNYSFATAGSPLLAEVLYQTTKDVDCPDPLHSNMKIYNNWAARRPVSITNQPQMDPLGRTSDSAAFLMLAGVPSVDFKYTYDEGFYNVPNFPLYHTACDNGVLMSSFVDTDYNIHAAVTEVAIKTILKLSDSPKLPMDLTHYGEALTRYINQLKAQYGEVLTRNTVSTELLEASIVDFSGAAQMFQEKYNAILESDELMLKEMNDHMIAVERAFLVNDGSAVSPDSRHLIYGLNTTSAYKGAAFSPIVMAIDVATDTNDWTSVRQAVGYTTLGIQAATGIVNDAQAH